MNELNDMTPEQLQAILGTDYQTVIADVLRQKTDASRRKHSAGAPLGQLPNGHVYFDPGGAIKNVLDRRSDAKDETAAQAKLDEVLGKQTAGRKAYADALLGHGAPPAPVPMATQDPNAGPAPGAPPAAPPAPTGPPTGVPPVAPGAPPALANASTMPPDRLAAAGVPAEIQALLAKLRNR